MKSKLESRTSTVRAGGCAGARRPAGEEQQGEETGAHDATPVEPPARGAHSIECGQCENCLGGALADRLVDQALVGDRGDDGEAVAVAAGDEQDELVLAGDLDLDPGERRRGVERGADFGPAVGPGGGAAGGALGGDDALEAALMRLDPRRRACRRRRPRASPRTRRRRIR